MTKRNKKIVATNPFGFVTADSVTVNSRKIERGTEISIKGESGRFRFIEHVTNVNGVEWVDVVGGKKGYEKFRSFRLDRIKTVHRIARTRKNIG